MTFANNTPFAGQDLPWVTADGTEVVIAVAKATFVVDATGRCHLADQQEPIRLVDLPWDPEAPSSVQFPGEASLCRPGTGVIIVGDCIPPRRATECEVGIVVAGRALPLLVHGPRQYNAGLGAVTIGPAVPFERAPLRYELAWGGTTEDLSLLEPRNPVGRGIAHRPSDLDGKLAPQIEHAAYPYRSASDRHPPVGTGALPSHWSPRREYFGTVDAAWSQERCPLYPNDFDPRYECCAHPLLQWEHPLAGGESISIFGMTVDQPLRFQLPTLQLAGVGVYDTGRVTATPWVDTVLIRPEERLIELSSRAVFPLGRKHPLRELRMEGRVVPS